MQTDATLTDLGTRANQKARLAITGLHDVEEDISSPTYGLKGKLDASIQALIEEIPERLVVLGPRESSRHSDDGELLFARAGI